MLNIPANFRNDIQGRDTALVPVVRIGNIWISTNPLEHCKPLLLNIPSLKESIDIEKRNYKISSVNLDISNFPYEGQRFSELIGDSSLINAGVDIYWLSPSSTFIAVGDTNGDGMIDETDANDWLECYQVGNCDDVYGDEHYDAIALATGGDHINFTVMGNDLANNNGNLQGGYYGWMTTGMHIYKGTVRRYTHDDEKVRLVVEDRSQATLHKDLPIESINTDKGIKYKPMVYGSVDSSPATLDTSKGKTTIWLDSDESVALAPNVPDGLFNEELDSLKIFDDGYGSIPKYLRKRPDYYDDYELGTFVNELVAGETKQYDVGITSNIIELKNTKLLSFELIQCIGHYKPTAISIIYAKNYPSTLVGYDLDAGENVLPEEIIETLVDGDNSVSHSEEYQIFNLGGDAAFSGILSHFRLEISCHPLADYEKSHTLGVAVNGKILPLYINYGTQENNWIATEYEAQIGYGGAFTWGKIIAPINVSESAYYVTDGDVNSITLSDSLPDDMVDDLSSTGYETTPMAGSDLVYFPEYADDGSVGAGDEGGDGNSIFIVKSGADSNSEDYYSRLLVAFNANNNTYLLAPQSIGTDMLNYSGTIFEQHTFNLGELDFISAFDIKKPLNKNFYANVNGRAMNGNNSPTAPQVIAHILESELGQSGITVPSDYDWEYAFCQNTKINSKKLVEGIASASPYIPRFNNMGEFKFDVIPDDGGSVTTNSDGSASENHTIKEVEVIDFSFSRTKIEDVCTKVIFKYNWDYARGEFNDSVESFASEILGNDIYDYYGFQETGDDPDAESTVTIDDDRGKYIRNHDTAQDFADWYLLWNANQHLKMKVKLPLKYMNLEIGDFIDFDAILGEVKPYGINYIADGQEVNGQEVFKTFLITSTNKTLEWVEIECVQMHGLDPTRLSGCNDPTACNYNEDDITNNDCEYVMDCTYDPSDDSTWEDACGGKAEVDFCGVCGGDTAYDDCGDCPGVGLEEDECGVCREPDDELANSTCLDCAGVPNGLKITNNCGDCVIEGDATDILCIEGCDGEWEKDGTHLIWDECDPPVCGGDGSTCMQCPDDGIVTLWGVDYDVATTTSISLENQGLSGSIPLEIGCLTNLTYLSLSHNQLSGEIPSSIENLTNLTQLRLRSNQLSGEIPIEIGQLTNLTSLYLADNQLTGEIPPEIGNLTNLTYLLYLHNNQLTGEIPVEIGNLTNLNTLWLKNNQLSGEIPPSICNIAGSSPSVGSNLLCPQYYETENEAYPSCISAGDIGTQDTSGCEPYNIYGYPGDVNGDGDWNVLDIVGIANCILNNDCSENADMNGDGSINVLDIVQLANCILEGNCGG